MSGRGSDRWMLGALVFLAGLPVLHPLLIPWVGVASHLLWWAHVLPVAMTTYRWGRRGAPFVVLASILFLVGGERLFGAGYGLAADWQTVGSLAAALTFTHLLVAGFALYARRLNGEYRLLFDSASLGILRVSREGRLLELNPAARYILQVEWTQTSQYGFADIPGFGAVPAPAELAASGGWTGPVELPGEGGPLVRHLVLAAVALERGRGHQILVVDRTLEAAQLAEIERQARLSSLGEALAGVAHELNNPLSVILGYAQIAELEGTEDPADLRDLIGEIGRQAERMKGLVQDLLGYSRPPGRSGGSTRISDLLCRLVRVERVARSKKIRWIERFEWEGELALPSARIEQIVLNLLGNAADSVLEHGGGTVELRMRREEFRLLIEVADDGAGIPQEIVDRIFDPFVTTKPEGKGTGLGLAISRRLAGALGGELIARNRVSGGALFTLALPLRPQASEVGEKGRVVSLSSEAV